MSNKVDQRIVEMRFDNAQFEKGVAQSINSINNLKKSLNFDNTIPKASVDSLTSNLSSLGTSVDSIADRFSTMGIMATTWIAKIANGVGDLAGRALQNLTKNAQAGYNRYNEMMASVQTIMYGTRDQWDDTDAQMEYVTSQIDKLNWFTDETSYNLSDMTNSIGKFVAAGIPLDEATSAMQGIATWAAISGQNAEKASMAMYNLSQAMAIGKVTAQDWKSIENANMATFEFKKTVVDLAQDMGKLGRTEEGWAYTTTKAGKEVLVSYEGMRSTLSYGWFDKELLTAVLKRYGDFADGLYDAVNETGVTTTEFLQILDEYEEGIAKGLDPKNLIDNLARKNNIGNVAALGAQLELLSSDYYSLGKAAFKAAQESKTFEESLAYTEDALTTIWMNIYQDIFGNYLQSKELWTNVSELMYEQLVAPAEEFEEQLASWNRMGGADHLKDSFWNFYETFSAIIKAVKEGWAEVFPNKLGQRLLYIFQDIHKISDEFHFGDVGYDFKNLKDAAEAIGHVFLDLKISFDVLVNAAKRAWQRIFPSEDSVGLSLTNKITSSIRKVCEWLEELSSKFRLTGEDGEKLERTFAGLFAILDIGRLLLMAIIEPFLDVNTEMGDVSHGILDVTASIGDWLVSLRDFIRDNEIFKKAVSWIMEAFKKIPAFADKVSRAVFGMGIGDLLSEIAKNATTFFMILGGLFFDFEGTLSEIDKFLTNSKFGNFWTALKTNVDKAWTKIKDFFGFVSSEGNKTEGGIGSFFIGVWAQIKEFFASVKAKASEMWESITGKTSGAWTSMGEFFGSIGEWIAESWSTSVEKSKSTWGTIIGFFKSIGSGIKALWDKLPFSEKINGIASKIKEFFTSIPEGASSAWSKLKDFFGQIGAKGGEVWDTLSKSVSKTWKKIKEFFTSSDVTADDVWESIKEGASNTWGKIKEFFNTVKTKALEIWEAVKEKVSEIWSKVVDFYERTKSKAEEIWQKVRPYVLLIGGAFVGIYNMLKEKGEEIWGLITRIVEFLIDKGGKAIDWIMGIDWKQWWEDLKKWCTDTWDKIKQFFEELPDKADEAFQKLTGVDFETFLQNLSDGWEELKKKVQEAWDATKKFFGEDLPAKMDEFAQKFGFESMSEMIDEIGASAKTAGTKLKWFFGIEEPPWMEDGKNTVGKIENGIVPEGYNKNYENGYITIKDLLPDMDDVKDKLKELGEIDWNKQIAVLLGLASFLGTIGLIYLTVKELKELQKAINDFSISGLLGGILGGESNGGGVAGDFVTSAKGVLDGVKELQKGAKWAMMGAMFLEIGAAFAMMATIDWPNLLIIAGVLGLFFLSIIGTFMLFDKLDIDTKKMLSIGEAFGAMASAFTLIGAAFLLMSSMDLLEMVAAANILGLLFGALMAALIVLDKVGINPDSAIKFGVAMGALSGCMFVIATSLSILSGADLASMFIATIAMGALFAELFGLLYMVGNAQYMDITNVMLFAASCVAMAGAMIMIAAALSMLDGMDPAGLLVSMIAIGGLMAEIGGFMLLASLMSDMINPAGILAFAAAVAIMSLSLIMIAGALMMLATIPADEVIQYAIALGVILGVMTILMAVMGSIPALAGGMLLFATAILLLGTGAMLAGLGMLMMAQGIETLAGVGPDGINAIIDGLVRLAAVAPLLAIGFGTAVVIIAAALGAAIVGFFTSIASSISENKETLQQGLTDFWLIIVESVINVLPKVKEAILMFLQMLQEVTPEFFKWINEIIEGVTSTVFTAIGAFLDGLWDLFVRRLEWWRDNIGDIVHIIGETVENFLLALFDEIETRVPRIIDAGMEMFINLCNGISEAVDKHAEDLKKAIDKVVNSIKNLFCELLGINQNGSDKSSSVFSGFGVNIMEGLKNGLESMINGVKSAISWVADTLKDTFTNDTEIQSPSKVFYRYGGYIDAGLANGLTDNSSMVTDATDEVANNAIDSMASTLSNLSGIIDSEMEADPTIRPVLDLTNVTNGINTMDEMLSAQRSVDLAGYDSNLMNENIASQLTLSGVLDQLKATLSGKTSDTITQNNVFNIDGSKDPKVVADEISNILANQIERKGAVWA